MSDGDANDNDKLKKVLLSRNRSKPDTTQGRQRSLQFHRCRGYRHRKSECPNKCPGKDHRSLTPVSQSNLKTRAMVAKSHEEAFTCVNVERPRSSRNSKKSSSDG